MPDPSASDDAAFSELRAFVLSESPAWSGRADYNPTDPALVDPAIHKVVAQRNFGRMPPTTDDRRRFAKAVANSVFAGKLKDPAWRDATEAKVAAYFADPKVTRSADGGLTMDLGLCPGPITEWSSGRFGVVASDQADRGELRRDVVAERLLALVDRARDAAWFELTVQVPVGHRSPESFRYRYDPVADVLLVLRGSQEGTVWRSPAPLGGDLASLATTAPTRTEELTPLRRGRDIANF